MLSPYFEKEYCMDDMNQRMHNGPSKDMSMNKVGKHDMHKVSSPSNHPTTRRAPTSHPMVKKPTGCN